MAEYKAQIFGAIDQKAQLHPVYTLLVPVIGVVLLGVAQTFSLLLAGFAGVLAEDIGARSTKSLIFTLFVSFGLTLLVVLAWVRLAENRSLQSIGWRFEKAWMRYCRGFAIGLLMNITAIALIAVFGGYSVTSWFSAFANPAALLIIVVFLFGFIIQGGTEEVLVRGWMMSAIASRWGLPLAVGVTSSFFAVLHLPNEWPHVNWIAIANIVLVGVFFALFALKERSLLGVCAAHASWNWIMSIGFGLNVSGIKTDVNPLLANLEQQPEIANWITGGSFGPEGSLMVSIVLLLAIALVWLWSGKKTPKTLGRAHHE